MLRSLAFLAPLALASAALLGCGGGSESVDQTNVATESGAAGQAGGGGEGVGAGGSGGSAGGVGAGGGGSAGGGGGAGGGGSAGGSGTGGTATAVYADFLSGVTADDFAIANEKGTDRVLAVPLDGGAPEVISEILCVPSVFGKVVACMPEQAGALRVWSHATGSTLLPEGRWLREANPAGTAILVQEADGTLARMTPTGEDRVPLLASADLATERGWTSGRFYALAKDGTLVSLGDADKEPFSRAKFGNVLLRSHPSVNGVVTGPKFPPGEITWIPFSTGPPVALGNWNHARLTADGTGLFLAKGLTVAYTPTDARSPVTLPTSALVLAVSPDGERMLVESGTLKALVVVNRAAPDVVVQQLPALQSDTWFDSTVDRFTRDGNHVVFRQGSEIWSQGVGGKPRLLGSSATYVRAVSGSKLLLLSSTVRLVDLATSAPAKSIVVASSPNYYALNPSMSRLAYVGPGGVVLSKPVE